MVPAEEVNPDKDGKYQTTTFYVPLVSSNTRLLITCKDSKVDKDTRGGFAATVQYNGHVHKTEGDGIFKWNNKLLSTDNLGYVPMKEAPFNNNFKEELPLMDMGASQIWSRGGGIVQYMEFSFDFGEYYATKNTAELIVTADDEVLIWQSDDG